MTHPDRPDRLQRYVTGLIKPAPMQTPDGVNGDPQFASLCAYLSSLRHLGQRDAIVDIGSGTGVVAKAMLTVQWSNMPPTYVSVDLEEPLLMLALPPKIHNNSRKFTFNEFIEMREIFSDSAVTHVVLLRNILHELNIQQTAQLIAVLNKSAPHKSEIFIQDMQELPSAESRNAPWTMDALRDVLYELRMKPTGPDLFYSHGGTPWFTIYCQTNVAEADELRIGEIVCQKRSEMSIALLEAIDHLPQDADGAQRELIYSRERATIDLQVINWNARRDELSGRLAAAESYKLISNTEFLVTGSPDGLVQGAPENDASFDVQAVLRSKDVIRMAPTLDRAQTRIWFYGFSNKHSFFDDENVRAIHDAVMRNVDVKILLVNPDSPAVVIRSAQPAYSNRSDLADDIRACLGKYDEIAAAQRWAEVRITASAPPCSYFIVDNGCVASLYTAHSTGTGGQSLVLRETGRHGDFYSLLANEFSVAFESADNARNP